MSEKLSERLEKFEFSDELGNGDFSLIREAAHIVRAVEDAPEAIMDTRDVLGICAPTEEDFPALYALQGKRVRLVGVE